MKEIHSTKEENGVPGTQEKGENEDNQLSDADDSKSEPEVRQVTFNNK